MDTIPPHAEMMPLKYLDLISRLPLAQLRTVTSETPQAAPICRRIEGRSFLGCDAMKSDKVIAPKIHYVSINCKPKDTFCGVPYSMTQGYYSRMKESDKNQTVKPRWALIAESLMREQGVTQEDLTATFNVKTRGSVGHYLSGRRQPSIDQLMSLAKRLGVSTSELIGEVPLAPDPQGTAVVLRLLEKISGERRAMLLSMLRAAALGEKESETSS